MNLRQDFASAATEILRVRLRASGGTWLASAILAVYYCASMSRDLSLYDSGELALAARELGLGHPPGQPLHTLLGFVASRLAPSALTGINLVSALPAALSLIPAMRIATTLAGPRASHRRRWSAPWILALFALHESLWEPATRIEVYALATLFALWAVAHALPLFQNEDEHTPALGPSAWRIGLALGLCASVNPVIAAGVGLALLPGLLWVAVEQRALTKLVLCGAVGSVLGVLPYIYLPLAAHYSRTMIWGGLSDRQSYLHYLTLRDYSHNQKLGVLGMLSHAALWCEWATRHLLAPALILGFGGFVRARWRVRTSAWVFAIVLVFLLRLISSNVIWNLEIPDYNGYMATAYWLAAAGTTAMFVSSRNQRRFAACAAIVLCLSGALVAPPSPFARTRSRDRLARALAERVLREAPPRAIVICHSDYFAGALFYLQGAERQRRDVVVLAFGLASSSWHWRHLQAMHPDLRQVDLRAQNRVARVQDWLAQNSSRPVLVENLALARSLELRACAGGLYLQTGDACEADPPPEAAARELLARQLEQLDAGSPGAAEAIAQVSEVVGSALWRLGWPREAHAMLLAGVPRSMWPTTLGDPRALAGAPRWTDAAPNWSRSTALGDPARNLFLAGALVHASGQARIARGYVRAAAQLDLPEAKHLLTGNAVSSTR